MKPVAYLHIFLCLLFTGLVSFTTESSGIVDDVLHQTNQFRRSKGLTALVMRKELNEIARKHSSDMASGKVGFGHSGFGERNKMAKAQLASMNRFAENVAYGAGTGKQAVTMWKNSRGHRKNMMGQFKYIGIGIAKDKQGRIFYTQVFAG